MRTDQREGGKYCFDLDLSDSTFRYEVEILVNMDCTHVAFEGFSALGVDVVWRSPSGDRMEEMVFLGGNELSRRSGTNNQLWCLYRSGIMTSEHGWWRMELGVAEDDINKYSVTGIGIRLRSESIK